MEQDEQRRHGHGQPQWHVSMEQAERQQHHEHHRETEGRGAAQAELAADPGREEAAEDAEHVEGQRADGGLCEVLAEQGRADQRQVPAHGEVLDRLADLHGRRQDRALQVHAPKDQQHVGRAAAGLIEHRQAFVPGCGGKGLAVDAAHGACRVVESFLAGEPDRAFDQQRKLQHEDRDAEDSGRGHRVTPDRVTHLPRIEQQRQEQVGADRGVPHALPGVEPALELGRREFGKHRHRDGEVDAIGRADEKASDQNHLEAGREDHQHGADHGQKLGQDERAYAAPAIRHPATDRIERDGDPRSHRGHQRHLARGEGQVARHGSETRAQCGIREGVEEQSAECEPPDDGSPADDALA
ncbi:hypothetical protein D3C86_1355360 [compost metagenome]